MIYARTTSAMALALADALGRITQNTGRQPGVPFNILMARERRRNGRASLKLFPNYHLRGGDPNGGEPGRPWRRQMARALAAEARRRGKPNQRDVAEASITGILPPDRGRWWKGQLVGRRKTVKNTSPLKHLHSAARHRAVEVGLALEARDNAL